MKVVQTVTTRLALLAAILGILVISSPVTAADKGMQFIGFSRTSGGDINVVANEFAATGGHLQFSFLPFEFNPNNPFGTATTLVQSVLPRLNGTLRMTVYVKWFPHDAPGNSDQTNFWNAWAASRPTSAQQNIRNSFMSRVRQTNAWIGATRTWAQQRGIGNRIGFTVVPVLEDTCPTNKQTAYTTILTAITNQQRADGIAVTRFRRSCLPNYTFRVGSHPLELHGTWASVRGRLRSGDAWSNDGTTYSTGDFIRDQRAALAAGVDVLFWRGAYNGQPYARANWAQRTVNPFTGGSGAGERQALHQVITSR